jgi:hypothetical protein
MSKKSVNVSELDEQLAVAKAKKAKKAKVAEESTEASTEVAEVAATPKATRPRLTDEQKAERQAAKDAQKAEKKVAREAKREAKLAEKAASRKPAHMAKVARAAAKLPVLADRAAELYNDITSGLSRDQVTALSLHLAHFNRVMATASAASVKLEPGMQVTITGGDPRFVGQTGVVSKAQRIRAYVTVEGFKKDIYVFTSDVTPVAMNQDVALSA